MTTSTSCSEKGIPIILLKTRSIPHDGYEEKFSTSQFVPEFVPVLEHRMIEEGLDVVKELLGNKRIGAGQDRKYGGMIFTSQRAVEAFAKLVDEGKGEEGWPHLQNVPIYTVGPATSRALNSIQQTPPLQIFGSDMGNGGALAHYMLPHYSQWYATESVKPAVLFLVGETRRDIIPKTLMNPSLASDQRVQVDELEVYGTGVMESFERNFESRLKVTQNESVRWVVVFSPTGCEAMLRALGMLDGETGKVSKAYLSSAGERRTFIATIGPTTRDYLKNEFGYEPDVCAETPSPDGVQEGILSFMRNQT